MGQRSGVINLGVDGIMLLGAFGAYYTALRTDRISRYAVLAGCGVGALLGLVTAVVSVSLKAEQGISGIGVYLFALGFSDLLFLKLVGTPLPINQLPRSEDPAARPHPDASAECSSSRAFSSISRSSLCPVVAFVLNRTTYGLNIKAVGREPRRGRQPRGERAPDPLFDGDHREHPRRASPERRC